MTTALTTLLSEELKRLRQQNAELRRYARHLRIRGDVRGSLSGTLATMGPAVPYAIGAEFAHPDRPAIAVLAAFGLLFCAVAALICLLAGSTWAAVALAVVAVIALVDLARVLHRKRRGEPG